MSNIIQFAGCRYVGKSTDSKPTGLYSGSLFYELDTLNRYIEVGTGWVLLSTSNGGSNVNLSGYATSGYVDFVSGQLSNRIGATGSYLFNLINASSAGVSSINSLSGAITIGGLGTVTVFSAGQNINISGASGNYVLNGGTGAVSVIGGTTINDGQFLIGARSGNSFEQGNIYGISNISLISGSGSLGISGNTSILATVINLQITGSILDNKINNLSGYSNSNFYLNSNPNGYITNLSGLSTGYVTGVSGSLQSQINNLASIVNLAATGSTLDNKINTLSGYSNLTFATIANLQSTGSNLQTQINQLKTDTGLYTGAFYPRFTNPAGYLTSADLSPYATTSFVTGISGTLSDRINSTGSYLLSLIGASSAGVITLNGISGIVNITGTGNITITRVGQTIFVSGDTGAYINFATVTNLAATGSQAWNAANNNGINLSGNLQTTGSVLNNKINALSGYVTGLTISNVVYTTGNQIINGNKDFINRITAPVFSGILSGSSYLFNPNNGFISNASNGNIRFNIPNGYLYDSIGPVVVIDLDSQSLSDSSEATSLSWTARSLFDASQSLTLDWDNRLLTGGSWTIQGANFTSSATISGNTITTGGPYYPLLTNPNGYLTSLSGINPNNIVYTTGNQTIGGLKNFTGDLTLVKTTPIFKIEGGTDDNETISFTDDATEKARIQLASSFGYFEIATLEADWPIHLKTNDNIRARITATGVDIPNGMNYYSGGIPLSNLFYPKNQNPSGYISSLGTGSVTLVGGTTIKDGQLLIGTSGGNSFDQGDIYGISNINIVSGSGSLGITVNTGVIATVANLQATGIALIGLINNVTGGTPQNVVYTTGDQTIAGIKTFNNSNLFIRSTGHNNLYVLNSYSSTGESAIILGNTGLDPSFETTSAWKFLQTSGAGGGYLKIQNSTLGSAFGNIAAFDINGRLAVGTATVNALKTDGSIPASVWTQGNIAASGGRLFSMLDSATVINDLYLRNQRQRVGLVLESTGKTFTISNETGRLSFFYAQTGSNGILPGNSLTGIRTNEFFTVKPQTANLVYIGLRNDNPTVPIDVSGNIRTDSSVITSDIVDPLNSANSINVSEETIYRNGDPVVEYGIGLLRDSVIAPSVDWFQRILSGNWKAQSLSVSGVSILTKLNNTVNTTGDQVIVGQKQFNDLILVPNISDIAANISFIDMNNSQFNFDGDTVLDWQHRYLLKNTGPTLDWENQILSGTWNAQGLTISGKPVLTGIVAGTNITVTNNNNGSFTINSTASGGSSSISNVVYQTGNQLISGLKIFKNDLTLNKTTPILTIEGGTDDIETILFKDDTTDQASISLDVGGSGVLNIGTITNLPIVINTSNIEVARFTPDGFFGLGTQSPTYFQHGGTNKVFNINNAGTLANSQSHLVLSTATSSAASSMGTITWGSSAVSGPNKGLITLLGTTDTIHTTGSPSAYAALYTRSNIESNWSEKLRFAARDVGLWINSPNNTRGEQTLIIGPTTARYSLYRNEADGIFYFSGEQNGFNGYNFLKNDGTSFFSISNNGTLKSGTANFGDLFYPRNSNPSGYLTSVTANSLINVSPSSNYTITSTESLIRANSAGGNITLTLPNATTVSGKQYIIKKISNDSNAVTITGVSSQRIDDMLGYNMYNRFEALNIVSYGTGWDII